MKITVLSSGSKGNATLIENNNINILIDAGITLKELERRINKNNVHIDIILITHAHIDHIKGLKTIYKKYLPIVYTRSLEVENLNLCPTYFLEEKTYIDNLEITTFNLSHDSDSVGFIIKDLNKNKELVYITDTGYINKKVLSIISNKDVYIIESNHDIEMLMHGKYPFFLQQRILSDKGHLSNNDCARYLTKLIGNHTSTIVLAHLSEENNNPDIALETLNSKLSKSNLKIEHVLVANQKEKLESIEV